MSNPNEQKAVLSILEQKQLINTAFPLLITVLVFAVVRSNSVKVNSKLFLKFLAIKFSNANNGLNYRTTICFENQFTQNI